MSVVERIAAVRAELAEAARAAGRRPDEITLVAVTKTHPPELVAEAIAVGALDLGENRVQEAAAKIATLSGVTLPVRWHLIGHLQRNKAKQAVDLFDLIHSVDSLPLAEALNRHASAPAQSPNFSSRSEQISASEESQSRRAKRAILLQVNVSGERSKEGFDLAGGLANRAAFDALLPAIERILALPSLVVGGLMTIAPIIEHADEARPIFARLRELRDELARRYPDQAWAELSMGMSDDFPAAIAEGSTIVRVGRAIFGER